MWRTCWPKSFHCRIKNMGGGRFCMGLLNNPYTFWFMLLEQSPDGATGYTCRQTISVLAATSSSTDFFWSILLVCVHFLSAAWYARQHILSRSISPEIWRIVTPSRRRWRHSTFIKWTGWTLAMAVPWWQHHKHCRDYYYFLCPRE